MIKKILVAFLFLPAVATASNESCRSFYEFSYETVVARASGMPIYVYYEALDGVREHGMHEDIITLYQNTIDDAYRLPNLGAFDQANHMLAADFASRQYIKCERLLAKHGK